MTKRRGPAESVPCRSASRIAGSHRAVCPFRPPGTGCIRRPQAEARPVRFGDRSEGNVVCSIEPDDAAESGPAVSRAASGVGFRRMGERLGCFHRALLKGFPALLSLGLRSKWLAGNHSHSREHAHHRRVFRMRRILFETARRRFERIEPCSSALLAWVAARDDRGGRHGRSA